MKLNVNEQRRKEIIFKSNYMLVVGFIFVFFLLPIVHADDTSLPWSMAEKILSGGMGVISDTITGTGAFGTLFEKCTMDFEQEWDAAYKAIKVFGALIAMAIAISRLIKRNDAGQDQMEVLLQTLMEFTVTALVLINLGDIISALTGAGKALVDEFSASAFSDPSVKDDMVEDLLTAICGASSGNWFWEIQSSIKMSIPYALSIMVDIAAKFAIIQVMVDIGIRRMFAPMAVVDVYQEGFRSPGARYLKKYFASFLKLAVIGFIAYFSNELISSLGSIPSGEKSAFDHVFTLLAINLGCVGAVLKGGEWTNDIMGV